MITLAVTIMLAVSSCSKPDEKIITEEPGQTAKPDPVPETNARQFTIVPDKEGRFTYDNKTGTYKPGDILNLKGKFVTVHISNLSGTESNPIIIRNAPGTVVTVGNPGWAGGAWAGAVTFLNSHHIKLGGSSSRADFIIDGSNTADRIAYHDLAIIEKSDNFEISNITIQNGGTGLIAKSSPVKGDPNSWYPNKYLENLKIHDVTITGTRNEGMYIGHTATWWNMITDYTYFELPAGGVVGVEYAQPMKWRNVKIYNNIVKNTGGDGIQTAASDQIEIYNNEITNWGTEKVSSHSGGLLVGGRITNSNVHDNYVHDGWGNIFQFFASGENGATHVIKNNLFYNNFAFDGISFRGEDNAIVQFVNNTVARTNGVSVRINGAMGMKSQQIINSNALIEPYYNGTNPIGDRAYVYLENSAVVNEGAGNAKFASLAASGLDVNGLQSPGASSKLGTAGYRKK